MYGSQNPVNSRQSGDLGTAIFMAAAIDAREEARHIATGVCRKLNRLENDR